MSFMQMRVYQKGSLYSCDCERCGTTNYSHEWVSDRVLNQPSEWAESRCQECGGAFDLDTFQSLGRQYACRYSADGYMDCTDYSYSANLRTLKRELRDMYGS